MQFWILYGDIFFLAKIPYLNFQINFQSSYLTKKETEDVSKRLSCYCTEALNSKIVTVRVNFRDSFFNLKKKKKENWIRYHRKRMNFFFSANNTPSTWLRILQNFHWSVRILKRNSFRNGQRSFLRQYIYGIALLSYVLQLSRVVYCTVTISRASFFLVLDTRKNPPKSQVDKEYLGDATEFTGKKYQLIIHTVQNGLLEIWLYVKPHAKINNVSLFPPDKNAWFFLLLFYNFFKQNKMQLDEWLLKADIFFFFPASTRVITLNIL